MNAVGPSSPRFLDEDAVTNTEYAVMLAAIVVVVSAGAMLVGKSMISAFSGSSVSSGSASGSSTLFSDALASARSAANWTFIGSDWSFQQGKMWAGFPNGASASEWAFANGTTAGDSTISVNADLTGGPGFGLAFRASGQNINGYTFQYDEGLQAFVMRKWVNGIELTPFASSAPPSGFQWTGSTRNIQVSTSGSVFTASIDGNVVLTGADSSYATGQAGLRSWYGTTANFSNFQVTTPNH